MNSVIKKIICYNFYIRISRYKATKIRQTHQRIPPPHYLLLPSPLYLPQTRSSIRPPVLHPPPSALSPEVPALYFVTSSPSLGTSPNRRQEMLER